MGASTTGGGVGTEAMCSVRILFIDDEKDDYTFLLGITQQIKRHKYEIDWVANWADAEERLFGDAFDLVICDFHLQEMNALDVMARMTELGIEKPVIILTADSTLDSDLQSMEQGAYDYLEKGKLTPETFDRCIRYTITRHSLEEQIRRAAYYDELTGLPNRRFLIERISQALLRAQRRESEVSLVLVDLNGFKVVNDDLGYEAGDIVLETTAQRIQSSIRRTDTAARWGGDEFIVVLEDFKERGNASMVIEKVMQAIDEPLPVAENKVHVSGSFGVVFFPEFCLDVDQLIKLADRAMHRAKKVHESSHAEGSAMVVMSVQEVGENAE